VKGDVEMGKLRKCVSWIDVYSPALRKKVRRCGQYRDVR
jgi:hypothetical protein